MGEKSQENGKIFEDYMVNLLESFEWKILGRNIGIDCIRSSHKNNKNGQKTSHGIDILGAYYNPFTNRNEAIIVECKNRQWNNISKSNVNDWLNELINTIECAPHSPEISKLLQEYVLIGGILACNPSDNNYNKEKAMNIRLGIQIPKKKYPYILYLADKDKLNKWDAFSKKIINIKKYNPNFSIIYPSIAGSKWRREKNIIPSYLFSDFILASYIDDSNSEKIDKKAIFYFDTIDKNSLIYLKSMINELQIEATSDNKKEICIHFFSDNVNELKFLKENFNKIFEETYFKYEHEHIIPVPIY